MAAALEQFGAPARAIADVKTCAESEIVWFGSPPGRVDLFKSIPGVEFAEAYANRVSIRLRDVTASVISIGDMIRAKTAAGRPRDLLDVDALRAALDE